MNNYEEKFSNFIKAINNAKSCNVEVLVVAYPSVLGDNYEELIESLNRIAEAGLILRIAGK